MPVDSVDKREPTNTQVNSREERVRQAIVAGIIFAEQTPQQKLDLAIHTALHLNRDLPDQRERLNGIVEKTSNIEDKEALKIFIDAIGVYALHRGIDDVAQEGLVGKLLPAIEKRDQQIAVLLRGGAIGAMKRGEFGVGEFLCHSYALKVNPGNINELLMVLRDIPSTNLARLEQNRKDAYYLDHSLRELVHDQRPYVHDLIHAMVQFYDTGDKQSLQEALLEGRKYEKGSYPMQFDDLTEVVFSKDFYEKVPRKEKPEDPSEKAIDVLRRLEKNTEPVGEAAPTTSDDGFNKILAELSESRSTKGPDKKVLEKALEYVNDKLQALMGSGAIGIEPNTILALAWLERQSFETLQKLTFEDQLGAYKQSWFVSMLKFHELTSSAGEFSHQEFDHFISEMQNLDYQSAYKLISQRLLKNIAGLAQKYKGEGKGRWIGALWSGNTTHELLGLIDLRQAGTTFGGRKRANDTKPPWLRTYGD